MTSSSIGALAPELRGRTGVSLDWGFHLPLRFADPQLELLEPTWRMRGRAPWTFDGDANHVYLFWVESNVIYFARSTDQGATFSPRALISGAASPGTSPIPAIGPSGDLYVVWGDREDMVFFDRSTDGGAIWSAPALLNTNATTDDGGSPGDDSLC